MKCAVADDDRFDLLVVANRLPVELRPGDDGRLSWTTSPGGLVTALEPVLQARGGVWVGWSGQAVDDTVPVGPPPHDLGPCELREVALVQLRERRGHGRLRAGHAVLARQDEERDAVDAE